MKRENPPGTYILIISLSSARAIKVGSLGNLAFEKGYYFYVGSALAGLRTRMERHLGTKKRMHWHIDYLLQYGKILEIWYHVGPERHECTWARALHGIPEMEPSEAPFGASDCDCRTHLFYSKNNPSFRIFRAALDEETSIKKLEIESADSLDVDL